MQARRILLLLVVLSQMLVSCIKESTEANNLQTYADDLLENAYLEERPGALVVVARGDEVIYRGARGLASIELNVPLKVDHILRIGSVTKQYTAAAILALVDEGKLHLDDPLSKFFPITQTVKTLAYFSYSTIPRVLKAIPVLKA